MKFTQYVLSFDVRRVVINFACFNSMLLGAFKRVFVSTISHALSHSPSRMPGRGGGTPYDGLYREAPPKGVTFSGFWCKKG